jgi:hypothetical protein
VHLAFACSSSRIWDLLVNFCVRLCVRSCPHDIYQSIFVHYIAKDLQCKVLLLYWSILLLYDLQKACNNRLLSPKLVTLGILSHFYHVNNGNRDSTINSNHVNSHKSHCYSFHPGSFDEDSIKVTSPRCSFKSKRSVFTVTWKRPIRVLIQVRFYEELPIKFVHSFMPISIPLASIVKKDNNGDYTYESKLMSTVETPAVSPGSGSPLVHQTLLHLDHMPMTAHSTTQLPPLPNRNHLHKPDSVTQTSCSIQMDTVGLMDIVSQRHTIVPHATFLPNANKRMQLVPTLKEDPPKTNPMSDGDRRWK